jgi:hypothetical protein
VQLQAGFPSSLRPCQLTLIPQCVFHCVLLLQVLLAILASLLNSGTATPSVYAGAACVVGLLQYVFGFLKAHRIGCFRLVPALSRGHDHSRPSRALTACYAFIIFASESNEWYTKLNALTDMPVACRVCHGCSAWSMFVRCQYSAWHSVRLYVVVNYQPYYHGAMNQCCSGFAWLFMWSSFCSVLALNRGAPEDQVRHPDWPTDWPTVGVLNFSSLTHVGR